MHYRQSALREAPSGRRRPQPDECGSYSRPYAEATMRRRASLRHHQADDGDSTLPNQKSNGNSHRDGAVSPCLQHPSNHQYQDSGCLKQKRPRSNRSLQSFPHSLRCRGFGFDVVRSGKRGSELVVHANLRDRQLVLNIHVGNSSWSEKITHTKSNVLVLELDVVVLDEGAPVRAERIFNAQAKQPAYRGGVSASSS